ncbi:MAG: PAS domain S-box protein, partial [Planctomycetota bacterium]
MSSRLSEEQYRKLFDEAIDGMVLADAKTDVIIDCNKALTRLVGREKSEVIGKPFIILHPRDDTKDDLVKNLKHHYEDQERQTLEARVITKTDEIKEVSIKTNIFEVEGCKVIQGIFRDITERKRAEEALRESEERYRGVVEDQTELICRWLPNMTLIFVNNAYCKYFGKTREELVGHSFLPLIPDEDHEITSRHFASIDKDNSCMTHEHRVVASDEQLHWMQWTNRAFFDENDCIVEYQSVGRDITERKQAEEAIRKSEEAERQFQQRLTALLDINMRLSRIDSFDDFCREAVEQARERLLGDRIGIWFVSEDNPNDIIGTYGTDTKGQTRDERDLRLTLNDPPSHIFTPEFRKLYSEYPAVLKLLTGIWVPESLDEVHISRFPAGIEQLIAVSANGPMYEPTGNQIGVGETARTVIMDGSKPIGFVSMDNCLTQKRFTDHDRKLIALFASTIGHLCGRRRAAEALRESEERYRTLLQTMNEGFAILDENETFTYTNDRFYQMLGYSPDEIVGHRLYDFLDEDNRRIFAEQIARRRRGEAESYEGTFTRKGGGKTHAIISPRPIFDSVGKFNGSFGVVTDITERKQMEEVLRENEERLQAILDNTTAHIFLKDAEGRYMVANRHLQNLFKVPQEQILGKTDYDFFPKEIAETYRANTQKVLESGTSMEFEEINPEDDGLHTYLSVKFPIHDANGVPYAVCGVSTDITDRKRAEEALRESRDVERQFQKRLTALLDINSRLAQIDNFDDLCRQAVEQARNYLGFDRVGIWFYSTETPDVLIGTFGTDDEGRTRDERDTNLVFEGLAKEVRTIMAKDFSVSKSSNLRFMYTDMLGRQEEVQCKIFSAEEKNFALYFNKSLYSPTGKKIGDCMGIWAAIWEGDQLVGNVSVDNYIHQRPFTDHDFRLIALFASTFSHLYTRNKAVNALRESEERYRVLVERNPHGIQEIDAFGTIIFANKAHHEIYGYEKGGLIGRSITDFLVPSLQRDELPGYLEMLVRDQPTPSMYNQKILTKYEKERDIEVNWNYLRDTKGSVTGFISILTDITDRK